MKAVVIHHNLNIPGGEATVAIETIQSLYELGYDVELITVQKPDLESIAKAYGKRLVIRKVKHLFPLKIKYFGIYQRLLTIIPSLTLSSDSDIVINTNGNILPYRIPNDIPYILYLHFPIMRIANSGYYNNKYQKSLFWKTYFKPYQIMANALTKSALARSTIILTISGFSKDAIRKAYPTVDPCILYPPVDIERFSSAYRSNSRRNKVLVISRFSPEKQIEKAIKVAQLVGRIEFEIIGSLVPANRPYFNFLKKMIQGYALEDKIRLSPNATNEELINAMSTSTVYLHTMQGEHFGVSIVEAMAAGLVPIVPSYGGCSEIVPPEYRYNTLEEAAKCICKNIYEYDKEKRERVYDIAKQFSSSKFREKMQQYIEQACNNSNSDNGSSTNITRRPSTHDQFR
jgi:alpha-1,2-mannosyltransferase